MGHYGEVEQIQNSSNVSDIPVASTATIYSRSFQIRTDLAWGLALISTSDGEVDVLVELEESPSALTAAQEGSSNGNFVEPEGFNDIINLIDEVMHIKQLTPVPMKWARLKFTGQGSNHSSTTVNVKLFRQGQY